MRRVNTEYQRRADSHTGRAIAKKRHPFDPIKRFCSGVCAVLLIMACSFGFGSFFSSAHGNAQEQPVDYKYYKSVEIQKGDSLWSIAEQYMGTEYDSVYDYIEELTTVNKMDQYSLDHLQEGDFLTVAYYDTQYK